MITDQSAPAKRSARPLSAVAKHLVLPSGIVSTDWGPVRRTMRQKLGIRLDGWQDGCGQVMLAKRENGRLACTVGGFGASLPRQVGKTYFMTGTLFALSINRPDMLSLWSAHHSGTHAETFRFMQGFCAQPRVQPFIKNVFTGSGDECVEFVNDSRILFGARERGWGRGIPNVDCEVFDEGQILSQKALENMVASMNRSTFGLHVYLGTPPKTGDMCDSFAGMRDEALAYQRDNNPDGALDLAWVECGADDDAPTDIDDDDFWPQVAKANPSYPDHTSPESILRLRKKLGPDGYRREGLGIWPGNSRTVFDLMNWVDIEDRHVEPPRRSVMTIHVGEYRKSATIAVAGDVGGSAVVLVMCGDGMSWVPEKAAELVAARDIADVRLCPGEARGLEGDLTRAGVDFKVLSGTDIAASCTAFQSAVKGAAAAVGEKRVPGLKHAGQRELDGAVAKAKTRRQGQSETWEDGTDSALIAAAAAYHRWMLAEKPLPAIF